MTYSKKNCSGCSGSRKDSVDKEGFAYQNWTLDFNMATQEEGCAFFPKNTGWTPHISGMPASAANRHEKCRDVWVTLRICILSQAQYPNLSTEDLRPVWSRPPCS